jgi:hypothetical protein
MDRQAALLRFERETIRFDDLDNVDLAELHLQPPTTPFARALCNLTGSQIPAIGDFSQFAATVKSLAPAAVAAFVRERTSSQRLLCEIQEQLSSAVSRVNDHVPFVFPVWASHPPQLTILDVQDEVSVIAWDTALLRMTTVQFQCRHYLIQRSSCCRGYQKSGLTLFNARRACTESYATKSASSSIFCGSFLHFGC